jgi:hypothetical protein
MLNFFKPVKTFLSLLKTVEGYLFHRMWLPVYVIVTTVQLVRDSLKLFSPVKACSNQFQPA